MKKRLTFLLMFLVVVCGGGYVLGNYALERVSQRVLEELPMHLASSGIELIDPSYETVKLTSFRSAYWSGLSTRVRIQREDGIVGKGAELFVGAYSAEVTLRDFGFKKVIVDIERLNVVPVHSAQEAPPTISIVADEAPITGRVFAPYARVLIAVNPFDLRTTVAKLQQEAKSIFLEGTTSLQADLRGELTFRVGDRPRQATILTEPTPEGYAFRLDPSDLLEVAPIFETPLTDAEVGLLAKYPLRTAKLLEIKELAEGAAKREVEGDRTFPEDAYRHVLWSFLLSTTYTPEFAKEVTDAHEAGATDNTAAEQEMDFRNNTLGRTYAAEGATEAGLLAKFLSDRRVVREPVVSYSVR